MSERVQLLLYSLQVILFVLSCIVTRAPIELNHQESSMSHTHDMATARRTNTCARRRAPLRLARAQRPHPALTPRVGRAGPHAVCAIATVDHDLPSYLETNCSAIGCSLNSSSSVAPGTMMLSSEDLAEMTCGMRTPRECAWPGTRTRGTGCAARAHLRLERVAGEDELRARALVHRDGVHLPEHLHGHTPRFNRFPGRRRGGGRPCGGLGLRAPALCTRCS